MNDYNFFNYKTTTKERVMFMINKIDVSLFKNKNNEDCLLLGSYDQLERDIANTVSKLELQVKGIYSDDEIYDMLLSILMKVSQRKSWQVYVVSKKITKDELYLIIKRQIFLKQNNL